MRTMMTLQKSLLGTRLRGWRMARYLGEMRTKVGGVHFQSREYTQTHFNERGRLRGNF